VSTGDPLFELRTDDAGRIPAALDAAGGAVVIADVTPGRNPLIIERISPVDKG
jgi:thymidine phosphorylase